MSRLWKGLAVLLAVGVALALTPQAQDLCCSKEWRRYPQPGGPYTVVVYRRPQWFAMPGSGSDAPGKVVLLDANGEPMQSEQVDMVQNVSEPEWERDRVHVKLVADWPLPQ